MHLLEHGADEHDLRPVRADTRLLWPSHLFERGAQPGPLTHCFSDSRTSPDDACRHTQGGDSRRTGWRSVSSVAFVARLPSPGGAIGTETQETVETEAGDNPRPGVHQTYKSTRDGQGREIGDGLPGGSSGWTSYQVKHGGVLRRHMPSGAECKAAHAKEVRQWIGKDSSACC